MLPNVSLNMQDDCDIRVKEALHQWRWYLFYKYHLATFLFYETLSSMFFIDYLS